MWEILEKFNPRQQFFGESFSVSWRVASDVVNDVVEILDRYFKPSDSLPDLWAHDPPVALRMCRLIRALATRCVTFLPFVLADNNLRIAVPKTNS
jgi:hypothetical protein